MSEKTDTESIDQSIKPVECEFTQTYVMDTDNMDVLIEIYAKNKTVHFYFDAATRNAIHESDVKNTLPLDDTQIANFKKLQLNEEKGNTGEGFSK